MLTVNSVIRRRGYFLRRRDLLALGYSDAAIRAELARKRIFRVRQGWYSVPDGPEPGIRAVRVGGRLTGLSALESFGVSVPRRGRLHVAVVGTASRLRDSNDRLLRLARHHGVAVHWSDVRSGGSPWRVPLADALVIVLSTEGREVAVACCSAVLNKRLLSSAQLDAVFARAPQRVRAWRALVSEKDEAHGETIFRLGASDAGYSCEQQVQIDGVGRFDFRLAPHLYVEIDGGQHDPSWTGESGSSWEADLARATALAIRGDRVLHFGYKQLYTLWPSVLAAIERALADEAALTAYRRRHPFRPSAS